METIIDKAGRADLVVKITLFSILILTLHVKYLSPVMGTFKWELPF